MTRDLSDVRDHLRNQRGFATAATETSATALLADPTNQPGHPPDAPPASLEPNLAPHIRRIEVHPQGSEVQVDRSLRALPEYYQDHELQFDGIFPRFDDWKV